MTRKTTWLRRRAYYPAGAGVTFQGDGIWTETVGTSITQGQKILRAMVAFEMVTVIGVTTAGTELSLVPNPNDCLIAVGLWTDMYNEGGGAPDPLTNASDPGWLMHGSMHPCDFASLTIAGKLSSVWWRWKLAPTLKWDVERAAGPVPIGGSASVYWVGHNYSQTGQSIWTYDTGGEQWLTTGNLDASVLIFVPAP